MYTVICDRCGKDAGDDSEQYFHSGKDAEDAICNDAWFECDWTKHEGGHYCPNCVMWNEDESELIPKPAIEPAA